jgi:hypothetical protein
MTRCVCIYALKSFYLRHLVGLERRWYKVYREQLISIESGMV